MQTVVVDSATGVKIVRDVERIEWYLPSSPSARQIRVYSEERIYLASGKPMGKAVWIPEPLILDMADPRIVQAFQLVKTVIDEQEWNRITHSHEVLSPVAGSTPAPTPTPTPTLTPTPPKKP